MQQVAETPPPRNMDMSLEERIAAFGFKRYAKIHRTGIDTPPIQRIWDLMIKFQEEIDEEPQVRQASSSSSPQGMAIADDQELNQTRDHIRQLKLDRAVPLGELAPRSNHPVPAQSADEDENEDDTSAPQVAAHNSANTHTHKHKEPKYETAFFLLVHACSHARRNNDRCSEKCLCRRHQSRHLRHLNGQNHVPHHQHHHHGVRTCTHTSIIRLTVSASSPPPPPRQVCRLQRYNATTINTTD